LQNFTWGQLGNIELLVGVTDIASSGDHLIVNDSEDGLDTEDVGGDNETLEHVDLGTLDLVILVLFVPKTVLVEPVVNFGLSVKRVAKVGRTRRGNPVHVTVSGKEIVSQLLVLAFLVLLHDTEVTERLASENSGSILSAQSEEK